MRKGGGKKRPLSFSLKAGFCLQFSSRINIVNDEVLHLFDFQVFDVASHHRHKLINLGENAVCDLEN